MHGKSVLAWVLLAMSVQAFTLHYHYEDTGFTGYLFKTLGSTDAEYAVQQINAMDNPELDMTKGIRSVLGNAKGKWLVLDVLGNDPELSFQTFAIQSDGKRLYPLTAKKPITQGKVPLDFTSFGMVIDHNNHFPVDTKLMYLYMPLPPFSSQVKLKEAVSGLSTGALTTTSLRVGSFSLDEFYDKFVELGTPIVAKYVTVFYKGSVADCFLAFTKGRGEIGFYKNPPKTLMDSHAKTTSGKACSTPTELSAKNVRVLDRVARIQQMGTRVLARTVCGTIETAPAVSPKSKAPKPGSSGSVECIAYIADFSSDLIRGTKYDGNNEVALGVIQLPT